MRFKLFRLFLCVAILGLMNSCAAEDDATSQDNSANSALILNYEYNEVELETMALINNHRISKGLKPLEKINHVSVKSEEHDAYMIANNVVNHDAFETRSANIIKVLNAKKVSENIAYNYNSALGVVDAWLRSAGHKENIEGDFTHFGISIRESPTTGKKYYTNIFVKI